VRIHIYIIKSNPPRRYCTKVVPMRLAIPYGVAPINYVAVFNHLNHLKG